METMKALALTAVGQFEIQEIPKPILRNPDDVLIAIKSVGICGSDVHYYANGRIGGQMAEFPLITGHECAGIVEQAGPEANFKPGDPVAVEPALSCHNCDQCNAGRPHTCRNIAFISSPNQAPGALQQYIVMPAGNCYRLKDPGKMAEASFGEPLSIGLYSVSRAPAAEGRSIGILGSGPIGLSVLIALQDKNPGRIFVSDPIGTRLEAAAGIGKLDVLTCDPGELSKAVDDNAKTGLDIVFECCGEQKALDQALDILKPGGTLVIVGIPEGQRISFETDEFRHKEASITYIRRQNDCLGRAIDLIESGRIDLKPLITHRFSLETAPKAFEMLTDYSDGVIKAMVDL